MHRPIDNVTLTTLDTGLTVAHVKIAGAPVDYCGVVVKAGSRDDAPQMPGMAHFVEHTIFKGTRQRSSWHIINRMERVGGELNAYTTKEETVVYTASPRGNVSRAMELVADLVTNSTFPQAQLDKEREVVADEINSYLDTPADAVYDDFEDLIFAGTPLGHNILGNTEALSRFDSQACREYLHRWYTTRNLVLFYCGSAPVSRINDMAARYFASLPTHECARPGLPEGFTARTFDIKRNIDSHQAHTVMGALTGGLYSPDRRTLALLTNILGGPGMNSLLNVALREKRGLVYSVEASTTLMSDCGLFTVYYGCDPDDTDRCAELVRKHLDSLSDNYISERSLAQAKKQYIGQLVVGSDNRESLAISAARSALYYNKIMPVKETFEQINSITPSQIAEAARALGRLSCLTLQ